MSAWRHSLAAASAVLLAPVAAAVLAWRRDWREGLCERLGGVSRPEPGAVWLHGSSIGEARIVARLAQALVGEGRRVVATVQTVAGRALLRREMPDLPCHLAPLDHPWCVDRALARVAPAAIVLVETEIWPCWIAAAAKRKIPIGILSGRISDRSWPRYRRIAPIVRRALGRLTAIGARHAGDAERFVALGADPARVGVTGDLKRAPTIDPGAAAPELVRALADEAVFIAASTHEGEERVVLEAWRACRAAGRTGRLVIAPRDPRRIPAIERLIEEAGRRSRRRSTLRADGIAGDGLASDRLASDEVLLLDTLGELRGLLALARIAFVGGSLVPLGGHDPVEVVQQGAAVAIGPHHANVGESVQRLVDAGAGVVVEDADALARAVGDALSAPSLEARRAGDAMAAEGRETLARSLSWIAALLDGGARRP